MKMLPAILACATILTPFWTHAQGTFRNLNFESAQLVFIQNTDDIATTDALPAWSSTALTTVRYNGFNASSPVTLLGGTPSVIDGNFSVGLYGGSIVQTGLVPSDAGWLLFRAYLNPGLWMNLSLGGRSLDFSEIGSGPNYSLYRADVSPFMGQTATLMFSGYGTFDDIQFVPEPSATSLILIAAGCFVWRRVRKPHHCGQDYELTHRRCARQSKVRPTIQTF